jgi:hypothetical protein
MNPFEKFMHPQKPNANEQMESNSLEKYAALIENAKTKIEGVLLYAPIPEKVREQLLKDLESIQIDGESELEHFFKYEDRGLGSERTAALYVDRKMRSKVAAIESAIGREEAERLGDALAHAYTDKSEYGDQRHAAWMNKDNTN